MANTVVHPLAKVNDLLKFQGEWGAPPSWGSAHLPPDAADYRFKLVTFLRDFTTIEFDHIEVGMLGRRICVFVAKGDQSTVLYDKTKSFPSAKLLASLTLLGSR